MTSNTKLKAAEEAVVKARQTLADRQKELAAAQKEKTRARALWDRGDGTSEGKLMADMEADRLTRGVRADEQRLKLAERQVRSLSPVLAEKAAHVLGDSIFGARAKVATSRPIKPTRDVEVSVIEVRTNEPADTYSGLVKGSVEIVVTGPAYLRPPDPYEVAATLRTGGINLGLGAKLYSVREDAAGVFSCTYWVEATIPLMPVLPRVNEVSVRDMMSGLIRGLRAENYSAYLGGEFITGQAGAKVLGETVEDGVRTVEVEVWAAVHPGRPGVTVASAADATEAALRRQLAPTRGYPGIGAVAEGAEFSRSLKGSTGHDGRVIPGAKVIARAKLVSKVLA
jgi:hypothetical protein